MIADFMFGRMTRVRRCHQLGAVVDWAGGGIVAGRGVVAVRRGGFQRQQPVAQPRQLTFRAIVLAVFLAVVLAAASASRCR